MQWFAVAIGGGLGAVARYALTVYLFPLASNRFPVGTLTANIIGSLLMGVLYVLIIEKGSLPAEARGWLMVGFLGAFTTFSTFVLDAVTLWQNGHSALALSYALISVFACILAVAVGMQFALKFL